MLRGTLRKDNPWQSTVVPLQVHWVGHGWGATSLKITNTNPTEMESFQKPTPHIFFFTNPTNIRKNQLDNAKENRSQERKQ